MPEHGEFRLALGRRGEDEMGAVRDETVAEAGDEFAKEGVDEGRAADGKDEPNPERPETSVRAAVLGT
jgi:hypothetical protein